MTTRRNLDLGASLARAQELAEGADHGGFDTAWPAVQALALLAIAQDPLRRAFDAVSLDTIHPDDFRRIHVKSDEA